MCNDICEDVNYKGIEESFFNVLIIISIKSDDKTISFHYN